MKPISPIIFWKTFVWSGICLSALSIYQTTQQTIALDIILWRSKWVFLLGLFALNIVVGALVLSRLQREPSPLWLEKLDIGPGKIFIKLFGFMLIVFGFSLVWIVRLVLFGDILPQVAPIFFVFLWASLIQALGLKLITGNKWHILFALTVLAQGLVYQIYGHLTVVSDYPFSIGYSEASRHYYASLFFANSLYQIKTPFPFLHPSRYFLMSLPFLVKSLPLWFHRLWQALLWIGLTGTSSILLTRRLRLSGWMQFFVAAWAFLYFLQGAVYYHLQVCIIIILAGVSMRHLWRSFIFILIASLWAGISRVNWFPVPAMLAIALYLLEKPLQDKGWRYWATPFVWGISGLGIAFLSQFLYISISGNADIRAFGSSFTSDLLWGRLLPNDTYPLGILPGIIIVSAPLFFALFQMVRGKLSCIHPLRWLALLSLSSILFVGGMAVSVKIGGGADLHNMDAFLVLLILIVTSFFSGSVTGDSELKPHWGQIHWGVVMAAMLVPIGFALPQIGSFYNYDHVNAEKDVQMLQQAALEAVENGGEVLFVTERQLLTFHEVKNTPLTADYEQIELMEMAMSGNREYLERYYSDLRNHRFAIIIAEEQKYTQQKKGAFIEENTAWVRYIGAPLLCAYKPVQSLSTTNIQVFVPRSGQPNCKDPFSE